MRLFPKMPSATRMGSSLCSAVLSQKAVTSAYLLVAGLLFMQLALTGSYNNFIIFRTSWQHLLNSLPLYSLYPEYFDYYLYHPSFPVLFAPFAMLPAKAGLLCWLAFNALIFLHAITRLPVPGRTRHVLAWFLLLELGNALQSSQTNPAMTAFMLLAAVHLQKEEPGKAAIYTCLAFFIKGYGAIIGLLFLFYPQKWRYVNYCLLFGVAGTLLPLLFIAPHTLMEYYAAWIELLTSSTIKEDGSIVSVLHIAAGLAPLHDHFILLAGALMLLAVFATAMIRRRPASPWLAMAALLIWIVIFNQSTESPTYIIAVTGAGIGLLWPPRQRWAILLLITVWVITSLFPTDLVPKTINQAAVTYRVKAIPCLFVLLYLQWRLLFDDPYHVPLEKTALL